MLRSPWEEGTDRVFSFGNRSAPNSRQTIGNLPKRFLYSFRVPTPPTHLLPCKLSNVFFPVRSTSIRVRRVYLNSPPVSPDPSLSLNTSQSHPTQQPLSSPLEQLNPTPPDDPPDQSDFHGRLSPTYPLLPPTLPEIPVPDLSFSLESIVGSPPPS